MHLSETGRLNARTALLCGACFTVVIGLIAPAAILAQTPSPVISPAPAAQTPKTVVENATQAKSSPASASDIVVTGTRVIRDGYRAPTPTTVIGAADIAAKAPANIADFVNELPSLAGSTSPKANVGSVSPGLVGINALNLRNLGANRTLVLLDGQRVAPSTITGLVDVDTLPETLVKRVDVVTGGASADWGSDAVAGVVNFVLDKDFIGLKGDAQGGVTTYGDDRNYKLSLTGGAKFAGGRGHILVSVEDAYNAGVRGIGDRSWYNYSKLMINPAYTVTNGQPQLLAVPNAGLSVATPGGLITSGPLKGTYFGPGGVPTQFNYGPIVGSTFMEGGDYRYADFGTTGDLDPRSSRQNVFTRLSYDVTDHVNVYAQGSYGRDSTWEQSLDQFNLGNITIQPDNAFIPASIATGITAPFSLGSLNQDLGPVIARTKRSTWRAMLGASGDFDALGSNWKWDVYGQRSVSHVYTAAQNISITQNYKNAIDAVRNTAGAIVCRSTLTNPNNECVPYDIFGTGVASQVARDYVLGTSWGRTRLSENSASGTLRGDPFSDWAGPISIATGIEYRREAVSGSNDPLSSTNSYFAGNYHATFGSYDVTEGFFEAVVPLAKDTPFVKSLDLNGAIRATSYSTSGLVATWKVGLTYSPIDDISFRITRSRDIRAPNLSELYQANQTSTTTVTDPARANASSSIFQVTQGNLNLKPEIADTLGIGAVFTPQFFPGFTVSADYYRIGIREAITTENAQATVNGCVLGYSAFCSGITRTDNMITQVLVQPINLAKQISRGVDIEATYRRPFLGGNLVLRALATRFLENYTDDGITPATDTVGTNGTNGTLRNSLPKWRYVATIGFDRDPVTFTFTARGFSAGVYNTSYVQCASSCPTSTTANMTINDNRLPGAIYFDTNIMVKLPHQIEAYLSVDNLLDKDPAQIAFGTNVSAAPLSVNPLLYDVLGRTLRLGLRFKM
jgi:outer membrane receptor protein involved in Fe transport